MIERRRQDATPPHFPEYNSANQNSDKEMTKESLKEEEQKV